MARRSFFSRRCRLTLSLLEGRDLPHGLAPMPGEPDHDHSFVGPQLAGHAVGPDDDGHNEYIALQGDDTMQAMGPFFIAPWQLNPAPIMADAPYGGPDGPLAPNPITYSTNAAGLPLLNSSLTSPANIYLDFDGNGTNLPYDTNGDTATFDATERSVIVEAWRQISVYYSMFDVNVTTVNPAGPKAWALISNSISGGYSYVGVFPNSVPESFNQSSDGRSRLSGIAHEIGHNFGLSHQSDYDALGVKTNEYSSGWTMHGPIMGVDFAQNAHKFFDGHPTNSATTLQDDLLVIANKIKPYQAAGGDGYRPDEHGDTIATATQMEAANGFFRGWGTVERRTDSDAFWFTSTGGLYDLTANTNTPSALNVKLDVYDSLGNRLATVDGPSNDQLTSTSSYDREVVMNLPAGTYYMFVSGHGDYADLGAYDVNARPLPDGWLSQSIGTVIANGYAGVDTSTGTWNVAGSGSDVWSTSDSFHYAYLPLTGDGSITARVVSMENTNTDAKAGVMIRESVAANARNAFLFLKPTSGAFFQARTSAGGSTTSASVAGSAPYWIKLTRTGNTLTGQVSSNGSSWTTVSSSTVSMASQVLIGFAVTSHNTSAVNVLNEAVFDSLTITGNTSSTPPSYNALAAPTNVVTSLGTGTEIDINWDPVVGATGYAVDRSTNGVTWTQIITLSGTTSFNDIGLSGGLRYFYRVAARSGSTRSVESTPVSIINRPSAPTNVTTMSVSTSTIVIDWRDAGGETGYRVERSPDGTTWSSLATVGFNVPSYTDTGLTTATTYRYRIIPLSVDGDGPASNVAIESTRLPAVTGLGFTSVGSTSVGFQWLPVANTTGYRIDRSTDGTTYTTLTTTPVVNYVDTGLTAGKEYYYRVAAVNAYSESNGSAIIFAATPATAAPPAPWEAQDIGSVTGRGNTTFSSNTFTQIASGSINSTADSDHFVSQVLVGDGTITARVATQEDTGSTGRAGVMIRESTAANSRFVSVTLAPTTGAQLMSRSSTGGSVTVNTTTAGFAAPYWVRITRVGNDFTGYTSTDGTTWVAIGSPITMAMTTNTRAGIVNSAGTTTALNTSSFDNVSLTQGDIAPAVFSSSPTGRVAGPVSFVDLVFAKAMSTTSFNIASDVLSFTGPGGNLLPFISGFTWISSTTLRVNFASQSAPGDYSMTLSPQILSSSLVPLDQNRNGTPGETSDGYTASFRLGGIAPDSGGYVYATTTFDSALNLNPATAGVVTMTALSNTDDAAAAIDLGTNVIRIYGTNYTGNNQLYVSSNGHITFGSSDTTSLNTDMSTPSTRAIFPLWDDLRTNQNTATDDLVLYQFQDVDSNGSMDRLVISWRNVHYYSVNSATDDGITFQAILELNSSSKNGAITFNYVDLFEANTGATNSAGGASVGVKGTGSSASSRTVISQFKSTTPEVTGNSAVKVFVNQAPTANAGGPYVLGSNGTVPLSAGASSDPDQTAATLTYLWDFDGDGIYGETGIAAQQGNEAGVSPTFNGNGLIGPSTTPVSVRAIDNFGLAANASSTVAIPVPPTVAGFVINDGSAQRSLIQTISVTFAGPVTLPANPATAFSITGSSGSIPFTVNVAGNTATLTLSALVDDRYTLTVLAASVTDVIGQQLDGNGNQVGGDNATFDFHKLWGDGNGDAIVDLADFALFRSTFNLGPSLAFDADLDGIVGFSDFVVFRSRYNTVLV